MGLIELGGLTSAVLAAFTLTGKIVKLITTIQSLINRIDQLQVDMQTGKDLWEETRKQYHLLDQRLSLVEYEAMKI